MKTLAVIIPRFVNNPTTDSITDNCISSVLQYMDDRFKTTITVVDDGSKIPFKARSGVTLIDHGKNRGIAVGWNTGWQANKTADFYCWLNADCEATPGWSFPLVAAAEQLPGIMMPYTNGSKAWRSGIAGYCFVAARAVAEQIGPFDETFVPAWYEDADWFQRAVDQGIPLLNVPTSNIKHLRSKGGTEDVPRKEMLHLANRMRFAWKHGIRAEDPPRIYIDPLPEVEIASSP